MTDVALTPEQVFQIANPPTMLKTSDILAVPSVKVDLKARLAIELNKRILQSRDSEKKEFKKKYKKLMMDKMTAEEERRELARLVDNDKSSAPILLNKLKITEAKIDELIKKREEFENEEQEKLDNPPNGNKPNKQGKPYKNSKAVLDYRIKEKQDYINLLQDKRALIYSQLNINKSEKGQKELKNTQAMIRREKELKRIDGLNKEENRRNIEELEKKIELAESKISKKLGLLESDSDPDSDFELSTNNNSDSEEEEVKEEVKEGEDINKLKADLEELKTNTPQVYSINDRKFPIRNRFFKPINYLNPLDNKLSDLDQSIIKLSDVEKKAEDENKVAINETNYINPAAFKKTQAERVAETNDAFQSVINNGLEPNIIYSFEMIAEFTNINQLFVDPETGKITNQVLIIYRTEETFGHYCCLCRSRDLSRISYFNSYGTYIDEAIDHIPEQFKNQSRQNFQYLLKLLSECNYAVHFNDKQLQMKGDKYQTCGRWAGMVMRANREGKSMEEFILPFTSVPLEERDDLIVRITKPLIGV